MRCTVCGSNLVERNTDLPFKVSEATIVIVKSLPVLQCDNCCEFLISDPAAQQLEKILANVDAAAELEIVRYAA